MTVHVLSTYAYCIQRQFMQRNLRKPSHMKVRVFNTRLGRVLTLFLPDCPGQLVTSLPDDDIKEIFYHAMPNTWKNKIVEQGYNFLDGPIHSIVIFFGTRIEKFEKSIPPNVPSRNRKKKKKGTKKRKLVSFDDSDDKDSDEEQGIKFRKYHGTCGHSYYR